MITKGYKNLLKQVLSSGGTSQGLLPIKDVSGTTRYLADYTAYPYTVSTSFSTSASGAGISVGSNGSASTDNTYQLGSTITSGLTGSVVVTKTVDTDDNSKIIFELSLVNSSSESITISEIGYKQTFSASDTQSGTTTNDYVFLIDRIVLASPVVIAASGTAILNYSLVTKFSAGAGGVSDVEVDGVSVVDQDGVAQIIMPTIPVTDVTVDNVSILDGTVAKLDSSDFGTTVVANPSTTATDDLSSIQIGNTVYDIPSGTGTVTDVEVNGTSVVDQSGVASISITDVEANPSQSGTVDLTKLKVGSTVYDIPSSGGGTTVVANPSGTATDDLETIQIGSTIYDIPGSGSGGTGLPFTCDLLFVNDPLPTPTSGTSNVDRSYTLTSSIDDYDAVNIMIYGYCKSNSSAQLYSYTIYKNDYYAHLEYNNEMQTFIINNCMPSKERRLFFEFTDSTHLVTRTGARGDSGVESLVYKIYGLKFTSTIISPVVYSTTEREIGVWTDGKPLYQITYIFSTAIEVGDSWEDTGIDSSDIENIPYVLGMHDDGSCFNDISADPTGSNHTELLVRRYGSGSPAIKKLILQYTKISDTPGSGVWTPSGAYTKIYSEDEILIGKYLDGKPLYQKCVVVDGNNISQGEQLISHNISDIDIVAYAHSELIYASKTVIPNVYQPSSTMDWFCEITEINSSAIRLIVSNGYYQWVSAGTNLVITLQYTKTTDSTSAAGQPNTLISKIDLYDFASYSTSEHVVGKWIDGKTLYERTWTNLDVSISDNQWSNVSSISVANVDTFVECKVIDVYKQCDPAAASKNSNDDTLDIKVHESNNIDTITLRYTKSS